MLRCSAKLRCITTVTMTVCVTGRSYKRDRRRLHQELYWCGYYITDPHGASPSPVVLKHAQQTDQSRHHRERKYAGTKVPVTHQDDTRRSTVHLSKVWKVAASTKRDGMGTLFSLGPINNRIYDKFTAKRKRTQNNNSIRNLHILI